MVNRTVLVPHETPEPGIGALELVEKPGDAGRRHFQAVPVAGDPAKRGGNIDGRHTSPPTYPRLKYRSPVSGSTVTTRREASSSAATAHAAKAAAPAEIPTKSPSSRASRRDQAIASSSRTGTMVSMMARLRTPGTNEAPMPWIA